MDGLWITVSLFAGFGVVSSIALCYAVARGTRRPRNRPELFLTQHQRHPDTTVVVCAGDSLTQGTVSASYVAMLSARLRRHGFQFVNAGVNGELAACLLDRLDEVITCDPAAVTVLIGTNDVTASLTPWMGRRAMRRFGLAELPSAETYRRHLETICARLAGECSARVALLSPPPIGEVLSDPAYLRVAEYAAIVREVAAAHAMAYLPLFERLDAVVRQRQGQPRNTYHPRWIKVQIVAVMLERYVMSRGYEQISADRGHVVLADCLHLNERGAGVVADLIGSFLMSGSAEGQET